MPDRLDILAFRSSAKLPKGEEELRRIRAMVYEVSKDDYAPFERLIDYWFASIAWAAYHDLELSDDDSGGKQFVDVGRGPNFIVLVNSWRIDVLNVLYLLSQTAFLDEPFQSSAIDTTAGRFNESSTPIGGSDVIKNANRYALAGSMPMLEALVVAGLDATQIPKQLAAAATFLRRAKETEEKFPLPREPGRYELGALATTKVAIAFGSNPMTLSRSCDRIVGTVSGFSKFVGSALLAR